MELGELQRRFQARVLAAEPGIEAELLPRDPELLGERVDIYALGYASRLVEALGSTFPALQRTLGESGFEELARGFIASSPSQFYSVRDYGGEFPDFLARSGDEPRQRTLAELAAFEWTLAAVFDAADDAPAGVELLQWVPAESWAEVRFAVRASLRRFASTSNAVDHWRAANGLRAAPEALALTPPTEWVLWRAGLTSLFRSLSEVEAAALDAVRNGASFAEVCAGVAMTEGVENAPLKAASLLRGWFAEELIAAVQAPAPAG